MAVLKKNHYWIINKNLMQIFVVDINEVCSARDTEVKQFSARNLYIAYRGTRMFN